MIEPLYLLDSNVCVYLLEGNAPRLRKRIETFEPGQIVTSAVCYAEVMIGAVKRQVATEAEVFFRVFPVLPFDQNAAQAYASIPFRRADLDRLIAGHVIALGLTLVTNNESDFAGIAGLRIENWTR